MGHLPVWAPRPSRAQQPWPRRRARRWLRTGDVATTGMMLAAIPSLPRAELARLTERLIDRMDVLDGDPDVEFNGDELDGHPSEDEFMRHSEDWLGSPGCPISDPGEDTHDQEWEEEHD